MTPHHTPRMVDVVDSITLADLPPHPRAVLAYVDGAWANYRQAVELFPDALVVSCATNPRSDAMVLDVEPGDATFADAWHWLARQHARGRDRPCLYVGLARANDLYASLRRVGVRRSQYRLWSAHWTGVRHLCGPECGLVGEQAGATQWSGGVPRAHWDTSWASRGWLEALKSGHA